MSDDFCAKLNAIDPSFKAHNVACQLNSYDENGEEIQFDLMDNVPRKIDVHENEDVLSNRTSSQIDAIGNHMVAVINMKGESVPIVVDPTNPGMGAIYNGSICMFNAPENANKKNEISLNFLRDPNSSEEVKEFNIIDTEIKKDGEKEQFPSFKTNFRPVVLNSIGSDFTNAALDEELIIKHMFPNKLITIYYEKYKSGRNEKAEKEEEKKEPMIQNILLYLKVNKIFEFDDAHNEKDENLKKNLMFNIYGFLFWEPYLVDGRDKKRYKIFFPKVFVFISQYPFFKYFSFLSQNIYARIKQNTPYEIPLEIQLYNIV